MLGDQDDISEGKGRDGIRIDKDKGGDRDGDGDGFKKRAKKEK